MLPNKIIFSQLSAVDKKTEGQILYTIILYTTRLPIYTLSTGGLHKSSQLSKLIAYVYMCLYQRCSSVSIVSDIAAKCRLSSLFYQIVMSVYSLHFDLILPKKRTIKVNRILYFNESTPGPHIQQLKYSSHNKPALYGSVYHPAEGNNTNGILCIVG